MEEPIKEQTISQPTESRGRREPSFEKDGSVSRIFLYGLILLLIAGLVGGLLGYVNHITAGPIAEQESETRNASMKAIFPDAALFKDAREVLGEDFTFSDHMVNAVYLACAEDGDLIGYCVDMDTYGYSHTAAINLIVGSDTMNKIVSVQAVSHSETPGIGERVIHDESFFDQFFSLQHTSDGLSAPITIVSGATYTSEGIEKGVNRALTAVDEVAWQMALSSKGGVGIGTE